MTEIGTALSKLAVLSLIQSLSNSCCYKFLDTGCSIAESEVYRQMPRRCGNGEEATKSCVYCSFGFNATRKLVVASVSARGSDGMFSFSKSLNKRGRSYFL